MLWRRAAPPFLYAFEIKEGSLVIDRLEVGKPGRAG